MILAQLQARPNLILDAPYYEHRVVGHVEQYKAVAYLIDGSRLHINEVWQHSMLSKYAYYWLTGNGELIQGWDNAPHHPQVSTYPHHSHRLNQVNESAVRTLNDVLDELERQLNPYIRA
jgi:hypothetical protein